MPAHQSQLPFRGRPWLAAAAVVLTAAVAWAGVVAAAESDDRTAARSSATSSSTGGLVPPVSGTQVSSDRVTPPPTSPSPSPTRSPTPIPIPTSTSRTVTPPPRPSPTASPTPTRQPAPPARKISSSAWYQVVNRGTGRCVSLPGGSTKNGALLQPVTCPSATTTSALWRFIPTSAGYYRVVSRRAASANWDVAGWSGSTREGNRVQLWTYAKGTNQQWMPIAVGNGKYKLIARHSRKCLDVMGGAGSTGTGLQMLTCSGSTRQTFDLVKRS